MSKLKVSTLLSSPEMLSEAKEWVAPYVAKMVAQGVERKDASCRAINWFVTEKNGGTAIKSFYHKDKTVHAW